NVCHDQLSMHGSLRNQVDYCVVCHNPQLNDGEVPVSFSYMVHKIHTGEEMTEPYLEFDEVLFPGRREECSICHVEDVPSLPISHDAQPINFVNTEGHTVMIPPTTAACTSCHDMSDAVAHAQLNTTAAGKESCAVCHSTGRIADIGLAHQMMEFLNVTEQIGPLPTGVDSWDLH
ncbi:MAG: cytochrome c3 family protein, partial [bacterium]